MIQGDIPKKKGCVKGGESPKQHAAPKCSKFSLEGPCCPSPPVTHADIFWEQLEARFVPRKEKLQIAEN